LRPWSIETAEDVFLGQNSLADRFADVPDGGQFVVAANDFGDGLSFLAAWRLWQNSNAQSKACLHFIAAEVNPLSQEELTNALSLYPEISGLANELIESYPARIKSVQRLVLDQGRVRLSLCFGDIVTAWQHLEFKADAWFFSNLNPETWNKHVVAAISEHSKPGSSFAADTDAGHIGRLLAETGFCVSTGHSLNKQQRLLTGHRPDGDTTAVQPRVHESIGIVGAGIAGCLLANNLAGRGFNVTLIDKAETVAAEASGNRQGALYVKLGVDFNEQTELALSSLLFSQRFYRHFAGNGWHPTGLIQLAYSESEADRQSRFLAKNRYPATVFQPVSAEQASQIAGIDVPHGGLWFPASGWLQPAKICRVLAEHTGVTQRMSFPVQTLAKSGARWDLTSSDGETLTFDRIVLCAGSDTPELIPLKGRYRMKRIRGQITEVPAQNINTPSVVICGPGYVNPAFEGSTLVGATFDLHDPSPGVTKQSDQENLNMLAGLLPAALKPSDVTGITDSTRGRVAFRCTTHDYQPVAGPMKTREGEPLHGVYLFTGLGSKGLTYSPLLAEYLGDLLSGQPTCLPRNLARRLETQRCHRE
jgi:tRNA 5-methylaminomethyl-2-thiouridine biosynthesis bifunctional protein